MRLWNILMETNVRLGEKATDLARLSVSQHRGVVPSNSLGINTMQATSLEKYKVVERGDLVLNRFNAYKGALGRAPMKGIVSPDYFTGRIDSEHADNRYVEYFLRATPIANIIERDMSGMGSGDPNSSAFSRFDVRSLFNLAIPVKNPELQQRIADYLDRETAEIDATVADLDQLRDLLLKRRSVLITDAVTGRRMRLEWIDSVPDHWTVAESQFVLDHQKRAVQDGDEIVTAFRDGQVTLRSKRRTDGFTMADKEIGYQHICEGDLVVHSMDGGFGAIGVSDSCGKASPVVHAYTSDSCDLRFISYQLRSAVNAGWIAALAKGIRVRSTQFDRPALAGLKIAYPSLETQQRIADYLDRETSEIDAAVADLDRYVELLEKRRSVLITDIVTGRTMSEWDTVPAGLVMDRYRKIAGMRSSEYKRLSLTLGGVVPRKRNDSEGLQPTNFEGYQVLPEGSLVFKLIDLENVATSRVGLSAETGIVSPAYIVAQLRSDRLFAKFGYYAFWDLYKRNYFNSMGSDGVRSALNYSDLARIRIPLPPLGEQQHIADYLDTETARIDSLIAESTRLRELLLQRRSVLITEVVTGRKQV